MSYGTVAQRRAKLGAGIREIGKRAGITDHQYGVGLWSQNRPEWQMTGEQGQRGGGGYILTRTRSCMRFSSLVYCISL